GIEEVTKYYDESIIYVEELIILCAKELEIGPIARHLFAIYSKNEDLWLASNQKLSELNSSEKVYELRVRFKPYSISAIRDIDENAFDYYFSQIRYDFLNAKFESKHKNRILGLVIADVVRYIIEKSIPIDSAMDRVNFTDFLPQKYVPKKNHLVMFKSKEIRESLLTAYHYAQGDAYFVKQEFMKSIALQSNPLLYDYGVEKYKAVFDKKPSSIEVEVHFRPYDDNGITISPLNESKTRTTICSISDLCFVSVQSATNTVEISRRNGIPQYLWFPGLMHLKSFVSCLDGFYRLTEKWTYNICREISSPHLAKLKSMKCHGPIDCDFAHKKLKEKGANNCGTYLLRETCTNFNEYRLDVLVDEEKIKTLKIEERPENTFHVEGASNEFLSLCDLVRTIKVEVDNRSVKLTHCLPPSEFDKPSFLLLCRNIQDYFDAEPSGNEQDSRWPCIIPKNYLNFNCLSTWKNNALIEVSLTEYQNKKVVFKAIKSESFNREFLKTLSEWVQVKCDSIINLIGVSLYSPLALVIEYLPHGPFDAFLLTHQSLLKVVDLIESVTYAARALWYLQENNLVHGRIRCHNLLVATYNTNTLRVKLSDPISDNIHNSINENVWIAPEIRNTGKTSATDVWAFGTTVWEIFSYGSKPDCDDVYDLFQPLACPSEVWNLIKECWIADYDQRKQPQSIVRDISQILYEVYNSRRAPSYYYEKCPTYEKSKYISKNDKSNLFRSLWTSQYSFAKNSLNSTATLPLDNPSPDLIPYPFNNTEDVITTPDAPEPWIIEINQLTMGKVLGQGFYGEVVKAIFSQWSDLRKEIVAVKRIKQIDSSKEGLQDMKREIEIMKKLNHKNIVEIKGFVEEPQIMLVMEYLELGSLVAYLKVKRDSKETVPFIKFACDIAEGMEYLESKSIVHRDLAARNILVATHNDVKISDFGLAQCIDPKKPYYKMQTERGLPLKWYAPESIKYLVFSHKSDVWSYGVTLWQMYSYGEDPCYSEESPDSLLLYLLESGKRLACPKECPLEVYQIMLNCWKDDPKERPDFSALKHAIIELIV
ncbi:tyrosine-protein kinase JAK2-like protein, partial [Dinothrombium tinctorium]